MTEIDKDELSRLVGARVHTVSAEQFPSGGLHSRVFACESSAGEMVLRVCAGKQGFYTQYFTGRVDWDDWMDQRWAIGAARSVGVPAPEIIASDREKRWVVMKRLPGVPLDSRYEKWRGCPYDEREFGVVLQRLHSLTPSGWGPINDWGQALCGTWAEFLTQAARSAIQTARDRQAIPITLAERLDIDWVPALAEINVEKPSLLHMESLGFGNIMYDQNSRHITGLLDYEDCLGGDPLFELAWMRYYFEHDGADQRYFSFTRFESGYGRSAWEERTLDLYRVYPYLDKLRWIQPDGERAKSYVARLESILEN